MQCGLYLTHNISVNSSVNISWIFSFFSQLTASNHQLFEIILIFALKFLSWILCFSVSDPRFSVWLAQVRDFCVKHFSATRPCTKMALSSWPNEACCILLDGQHCDSAELLQMSTTPMQKYIRDSKNPLVLFCFGLEFIFQISFKQLTPPGNFLYVIFFVNFVFNSHNV